MDEITYTAKALAAIVAADAAIVKVEKEAFGKIVARYCKLGTEVRALPDAVAEGGKLAAGVQARVLKQAGGTLSQSRLSRACTIAAAGKEGYDLYIKACGEETNDDGSPVVPTLTGLMSFLKGDAPEAPILTGKALVDDTVKRTLGRVNKALEGLNARQRKAAIAALVAALEAE